MKADHDAAAALLRQAVQGLAGGGRGQLCGVVLGPNLRWHEPGRNLLAGDYTGCDEVVGHLFSRLAELSDGTFRVELEAVAAGDGQAMGVYTARAERRGMTLVSRDVCIVEIDGASIVSGRVYHADQRAWDRFWS